MNFTRILSATIFVSFSAFAHQQHEPPSVGSFDGPEDDSQLIQAVNSHHEVNYLVAYGLTVTKILPDDLQGLEHQKFIVQMSNGKTVMAVYNIDMCPRVPVKVGDTVSLGGQFIWTPQGGLVHWLHHDPKGERPAGFVGLNGVDYCRQ